MLSLTPRKIVLLYAVSGVLWIAFSDFIVLSVFGSPGQIATAQTLKGAAFVAVSSAIILGLTSYREYQLQDSRQRLQTASERAQVLQRVFRHNIRNDLNVVQGNIDMVKNGYLSPEDNKRLEKAEAKTEEILAISEKLKIIDNYDMTSQIGDRIDLVSVVEAEVSQVKSMDDPPTVVTDLPEHAEVIGDNSICFLISELLHNSVEHFDGERSSLRISVKIEEEPDRTVLTLTDNGPGIPAGEMEALEKKSETNLVHPSSVGLWVVNWLCDRVDCELTVESIEGLGTSITLDFQKPVSLSRLHIAEEQLMPFQEN